MRAVRFRIAVPEFFADGESGPVAFCKKMPLVGARGIPVQPYVLVIVRVCVGDIDDRKLLLPP